MSLEKPDKQKFPLDKELRNAAIDEIERNCDEDMLVATNAEDILERVVQVIVDSLSKPKFNDKVEKANQLIMIAGLRRFGVTTETARQIVDDILKKIEGSQTKH